MRRAVGVLICAAALGGCVTLTPDEKATACRASNITTKYDPRIFDYPCRNGTARWNVAPAIYDLQKQFAMEDADTANVRKEAAEREERERQATEAQQKAVEAAYAEAKTSPRFKNRRREKFASYEDADNVLQPESAPWLAGGPTASFMRTKDHIIRLDAQVMQVVDRNTLLANPCYVFHGAEPLPEVCPVFVRLALGCGGDRDLIDDMHFSAVVELEGTKQYETAMGVQKTVPQFVAYGVQPARN